MAETPSEFRARMVKTYPDELICDQVHSVLKCIYCDFTTKSTKISNIKQHLKNKTHLVKVEKNKKSKVSKQTFLTDYQRPQQINEFNMDLCTTFLEANIPLKKVSHPSVIKFVEKYTGKAMPSESSLRQKYVPILYNDKLEVLREKAENNYIWASVDETTDAEGRFVANFIFGILDDADDSRERGKCYLLNMAVLEKTNASTIGAFFFDSLSLLWPNGK